MFTEVVKRNGETVPFDQNKIIVAMRKAFTAENTSIDESILEQMTDRVVAKLHTVCEDKDPCPTVEHVQDLVEETLMERGYFVIAKHYILYRFEHTKERKEKVVKDIEENRLMVKTKDGEKQFSREKMQKYVKRFVSGVEEDIDIEGVVTQIEREVYDGIATKELAKLVTLVLRARIETDPSYTRVAARQLCASIYNEAIGKGTDVSDKNFEDTYRDAFTRNIKRGIKDKKLASGMAEFNIEKMAEAIDPARDDLLNILVWKH